MSPRRGRAQALVELALIAPVLILLAMVVWDGGGVLREQVVLNQAARDGARLVATQYAATSSPPPPPASPCSLTSAAVVNAAVLASANDLPSPTNLSVLITCPVLGKQTDPLGLVQTVTVEVSYVHSLMTPVLRQAWAGGLGAITLTSRATFYLKPDCTRELAHADYGLRQCP